MALLGLGAAFTGLWLDELHELVGTYQRSWGELLYWSQISPGATPLNFVAQKLALDALGFSSFTVRLPAIVFGAASLWMFLRVAREYARPLWLLAAVVFSLLPHVYRYGVEARPYSQGLFFALLAFWFWTRLDREGSHGHVYGFGLAVAACLYSQVYSVFGPLTLAGWSVWRNAKWRLPILMAMCTAVASYVPWFLIQRATQTAARANTYALDWAHLSLLGYIRELAGGGYFCSVPLLLLAGVGAYFTKDMRLVAPAAAGLVMPLIADAMLGYYFAGRQLIFALPFLVLLAVAGAAAMPKWGASLMLIPLLGASLKYDFRQATTTLEDWETPARKLASHACVYVWDKDQLQYLRVYERGLRECDRSNLPAEFPFVTTRYSPPTPPSIRGYSAVHREKAGLAEIVYYRRDASLKTYGLSRFVFRP
ncbi:MAG TPA: glycosyltransferase family 39 protein [Bryobacteraceae bacterium]|nr:glycosyltransferase family 39 protein [Bryobacteraceae bacterium]